MAHIGCKHLDYETKFNNCELIEDSEGYKWWVRKAAPYAGAPTHVQFCKKFGRINQIFGCIKPGEKSCFEEQEEE